MMEILQYFYIKWDEALIVCRAGNAFKIFINCYAYIPSKENLLEIMNIT